MQTVLPSEFKRGMVLMLSETPQVLEDFHSSGAAQSKHKLHGRLRDLKTGRINDHTFSENERVPVAELVHHKVSFSYETGDSFIFLDSVTFEELTLGAEQIGDRRWFLKENEEYKAMFLEGKLLDIILPPSVVLQVAETAEPIRGGSDSTWKEARLDTGLEVMVPLFIAPGELVRVDTAQRKYVGKEAGERR